MTSRAEAPRGTGRPAESARSKRGTSRITLLGIRRSGAGVEWRQPNRRGPTSLAPPLARTRTAPRPCVRASAWRPPVRPALPARAPAVPAALDHKRHELARLPRQRQVVADHRTRHRVPFNGDRVFHEVARLWPCHRPRRQARPRRVLHELCKAQRLFRREVGRIELRSHAEPRDAACADEAHLHGRPPHLVAGRTPTAFHAAVTAFSSLPPAP